MSISQKTIFRALLVLLVGLPTIWINTACDITSPQGYYRPLPSGKIEKSQSKVTFDGRILVVKEGNIWLLTQNAFKQVTTGGRSRQPAWSPDGKQVALVKMGDSFSDIWLMNADGSNARAITNFRSANLKANHWAFQPAWSPDGKQLAYVSEEATPDLALWVMNADGTGRRQVAATPERSGGIDGPDWSPDGTRIAFAAYRGAVSQIWVLTLRTGQWQQLTNHPEGAYDACWSPDGKLIAYVARENGKNNIWVMNADGTAQTRLTRSGWGRSPKWSPDGTYLGYLDGQSGYFDLWITKITFSGGKVTAGEPEQVTVNAQLDPVSGLTWAK